MNKLRVATIFSGIGAPEQALERLGIEYDLVFACDNGDRIVDIDYEKEYQRICNMDSPEEKAAYAEKLYADQTNKQNNMKKTFMANYTPGCFFEDVKLLDGRDFNGKVDLFVGGSPCQSFSIAGFKGGFSDTRGTLFYEYCRLVKELNPKVFIYENVSNVLRHDGGKTWEIMKSVFAELGYSFSWAVLNAKDYGIPQSRNRLFVVGIKNEEIISPFSFPQAQELSITMQDFLEDNHVKGSIHSVNGKLVPAYEEKGEIEEYYFLTPGVLKYVTSPGTKNFFHPGAKTDLPIARALLSTMHNHHRSSVDNYVTTNGRLRELTITEGLRLMGFPDSFNSTAVSRAQMYRQIGNSIVVDVMMAIIEKIMEAMGWDETYRK